MHAVLEDTAYSRHTRNDRNLPQWFLDDERKYAAPPGYGLELDECMLEKARNGLKDITARSISKVAEAKGRKMRRMQRALTKLRKKANAVVSKEVKRRNPCFERRLLLSRRLSPSLLLLQAMPRSYQQQLRFLVPSFLHQDISEREKAREVEKLYKKKINSKDHERKRLVVGRRFEAGSSGKKAHGIKMVDRRMLNDVRAEKAAFKRSKGAKGGNAQKSKGNRQHKVKVYRRSARK